MLGIAVFLTKTAINLAEVEGDGYLTSGDPVVAIVLCGIAMLQCVCDPFPYTTLPSHSSHHHAAVPTAWCDLGRSTMTTVKRMLGCSPVVGGADLLDEQLDNAIGKKLKADRRLEAKVVKLLLLGAGESGKSTIFKQVWLLPCPSFANTFVYLQLVHSFSSNRSMHS